MLFRQPNQTAGNPINKRLIEEGSGVTGPIPGGLKVRLSNTSAPASPVKTADSNGRGRPASGDAAAKAVAVSGIVATRLPLPQGRSRDSPYHLHPCWSNKTKRFHPFHHRPPIHPDVRTCWSI